MTSISLSPQNQHSFDITDNYIIIDNTFDMYETHKTWIELCNINLSSFNRQKKIYTKISKLSKYFIPNNPSYFFKDDKINIKTITTLFNTIHFKCST